ncbi:FAD-binding oxidoreductase [Acidiphilium sp. AL]|uniref:FAD-binding oxidoreductase n=1 Tax=Acidiphilium iwatense TaxID=768198 RepID=A0ABS9E476_9PROT|nr:MULTISPECIES: FAD-binding oxidoreductase [Acidiphilium]MCF3948389.1 FAD-binding oxidoreductase [Acidiphilium iwatense]MCU4161866.1 FAD-binding oxidoreductase [Acidiphilium sp. AL]
MNDLIDRLAAALGPGGVLTESADIAPFGTDWRGLYANSPRAVLRPRDADGVAASVRLCAEAGVAIVPQGGNTSLVAGAVPSRPGAEFVLSLARLNRVRAIDRAGLSMIAEAGVTLLRAQEEAAEAGALLPLSINSEGSAQLGGVLSTNAGGNNTLRFGNARDLILGLEVVLPDGTLWNGLRLLRKDNTGYALKHLFAGAEGTLGIITAAALKLYRAPRERQTCLCALPGIDAVLDLFARLRDEDESALYAFEYISGPAMALNARHMPDFRLPFAEPAAHYVLAELATTRRAASLRETLESVLAGALEHGTIADAAIAESETQRRDFWAIREHIAESQKREGTSVKNDVSVPIASVPDLLDRTRAMLTARYPGARMAAFGHIGDGNIHLNVIQPEGEEPGAFDGRAEDLMEDVNAIVAGLGGSFSAEHGVGMIKRPAFAHWRAAAERDAMRRIKDALDPRGIMNPGKLF